VLQREDKKKQVLKVISHDPKKIVVCKPVPTYGKRYFGLFRGVDIWT